MKTKMLPTLAAGWLIAMFASPALAAPPNADGLKVFDAAAPAAPGETSPCPDHRVTIGLSGGSLIGVSVDLAVLRAELANGGTVLADGAGIVLSERALDALLDTALNEHMVRANLLVERAGLVYLEPRGAACLSMLHNVAFVTRAGGVPGDSVTLLPIPPGAPIPVFIAGGAGNLPGLPFRTPDFNTSNVITAATPTGGAVPGANPSGALPVGGGVSPSPVSGSPGTTGPTGAGSTPSAPGVSTPTNSGPVAPGTTVSTGAGSTPSTPGASTPTPGVSTPPNSGPVANAPGTTVSTGAGSTPSTPGVSTPTPGVSTPPNPGGSGNGNNGFGNGGRDGTAGRSGKSDGNR